MDMIEPKILKGFRDFLPEYETKRRSLIHKLEKVFSDFGYVPIDTPVLEYSDILLGKGGGETDKQLFRFFDSGQRDVAMRYDLTVPFARFMAMYKNELYLPFKRYHIDKVWRGEKPQKGRYREFTQCDFDIVGVDAFSADFDILLLMVHSLKTIGVKDFFIHFSHRGVFNSYLNQLGLTDQAAEILKDVDKIHKIGQENLAELLVPLAGPEKSGLILDFIKPEESLVDALAKLTDLLPAADENLQRLVDIKTCLDETQLTSFFRLDPSITRGLDYYTGLVFETFLSGLPSIGSVCSGGRYNNLTGLYSKETMPGVGASIGLDRLLAALEELDVTVFDKQSSDLLILCLDINLIPYYHKIAMFFREHNIITEIYYEKKKLVKQFNFAEKKNIPYVCLCGEEERAQNSVTIKDMRSRVNSEKISLSEAVNLVKKH